MELLATENATVESSCNDMYCQCFEAYLFVLSQLVAVFLEGGKHAHVLFVAFLSIVFYDRIRIAKFVVVVEGLWNVCHFDVVA